MCGNSWGKVILHCLEREIRPSHPSIGFLERLSSLRSWKAAAYPSWLWVRVDWLQQTLLRLSGSDNGRMDHFFSRVFADLEKVLRKPIHFTGISRFPPSRKKNDRQKGNKWELPETNPVGPQEVPLYSSLTFISCDRWLNCLSVYISVKSNTRLISLCSGLRDNEIMRLLMDGWEEKISNQEQALSKLGWMLLAWKDISSSIWLLN